MKKKLALLFIIIGFALIALELHILNENDSSNNSSEEILNLDYTSNEDLPVEPIISFLKQSQALELVDEVDDSPKEVIIETFDEDEIIGSIRIDKIDSELPIINGFDLDAIENAIGYMAESDSIGGIGNAVFAGHRSYTYGVLFNRLNEVEIGDDIVITVDDVEYVYTVFQKRVVDPDNEEVLKSSTKYKVITLITCHPVVIANKRLIIHAMME